jgi:acetyl esterase/lipase
MSFGLGLAAEPVVHRDLAYAQPKNERQSLDVYAPIDATNRPMMVWIHGGAWERGDKTLVHHKPQAFVDHGFVFVSINHRFVPDVTIREIMQDVAKAIRFACDHAREFGGDPNTLFVGGHSSGAHLAALVCTDERYLQAEGLSFGILKGCVPVDGNTFDVVQQVELTELLKQRPPFTSHRIKFGTTAMQRELSPVTYVARDRGIPPFLILHIADFPETQPSAQTTGLQSHILANALLREALVPVKVVAIPGRNHRTIDSDIGLPEYEGTKAIFEFLAARTNPSRLQLISAVSCVFAIEFGRIL